MNKISTCNFTTLLHVFLNVAESREQVGVDTPQLALTDT